MPTYHLPPEKATSFLSCHANLTWLIMPLSNEFEQACTLWGRAPRAHSSFVGTNLHLSTSINPISARTQEAAFMLQAFIISSRQSDIIIASCQSDSEVRFPTFCRSGSEIIIASCQSGSEVRFPTFRQSDSEMRFPTFAYEGDTRGYIVPWVPC